MAKNTTMAIKSFIITSLPLLLMPSAHNVIARLGVLTTAIPTFVTSDMVSQSKPVRYGPLGWKEYAAQNVVSFLKAL